MNERTRLAFTEFLQAVQKLARDTHESALSSEPNPIIDDVKKVIDTCDDLKDALVGDETIL